MGPRAVALGIVLGASTVAQAGVVTVTNVGELSAAINGATAGTEIVLADGTYLSTGANCTAVGTETAPIVVRAATPLGAKIDLDALEGFKVSGAHWHFEGLDVRGVCSADDNCEHAFHVFGAAHGFTLRNSRVRDFNAQLKVNAAMIGGVYVAPDRGLIEYNELGDTRGRNTGNPVTKLNVDTGDDWVIRGNYLHDAVKLGGNGISYLAFFKSGGKRGVMERNLALCTKDVATGGVRIGLSLGGGGTAAQFCAPAYDAGTPCNVEHDGGTLRNNIIANCGDVGVYLNHAKDSHVLFNTVIGTAGIDFRYDTTTGEAVGNVLSGVTRNRDLATVAASNNLENVGVSTFQSWYTAPLIGDLSVTGDVSSLVGAGPTRADVTDDYCARARPSGALTLGALEHSLGACTTTTPPVGSGSGSNNNGDDPGGDGAGGSGSGEGCCGVGDSGASTLLLVAVLGALRRRVRASRRSATRRATR